MASCYGIEICHPVVKAGWHNSLSLSDTIEAIEKAYDGLMLWNRNLPSCGQSRATAVQFAAAQSREKKSCFKEADGEGGTESRPCWVLVYDLRRSEPVSSLYGHHLGVSTVQMDDWKVVSGGEGGLVCVWDQRMGSKLWEMHARHPVRHLRFNSHSLITANVPNEKTPRGASIMDDDLTAHRRHRGIIYAYEFSVDQLVAESVLPICRSTYNEMTGYSYNIGLVVPYDNI